MRGAHWARTVRLVLRGISIPVPFSLEEFCHSVGERRGKPVLLLAVPAVGPGWLGAWVSARDAELVCHPAGITGLRRDQIAVHHLCHLLLGHRGRPAAGLAALVAPRVSPLLVELMLGTDEGPAAGEPYADEQEQAADAMSSLILARASRLSCPCWPPDDWRKADSFPPGDCPSAALWIPSALWRLPAGRARWSHSPPPHTVRGRCATVCPRPRPCTVPACSRSPARSGWPGNWRLFRDRRGAPAP